jgi:hypothetical protein
VRLRADPGNENRRTIILVAYVREAQTAPPFTSQPATDGDEFCPVKP